MKLIAGLGNPGGHYAGSRHNIGFTVVKKLARLHGIRLKNDSKSCSLSGCGKIEGEKVILVSPLTFMNLSGHCIKLLLEKYRVEPESLLVICDDLDLELGRIKIRPGGSSGGHRGLSSVIGNLGTQGFHRLRIGIGRPQSGMDTADYVLSAFNKYERKKVKEAVDKTIDCCRMWLIKGVGFCMNTFNKSASASLNTSTRSSLSERSEPKEKRIR